MNKIVYTITAEELLTIYYIACNSWKEKLKAYLIRIGLDNKINLSEDEVQEMFKAATVEQKETLNKIFPNRIDLSIVNDTDWFYVETPSFAWLAKGNIVANNIENPIHYCLYTNDVSTKKLASFNIRNIKVLRKATKEEIEAFYNKFPQYKEKPKWEDFGKIKGHFISSTSDIIGISEQYSNCDNKNTWPTREEAEAALALSQLCQWRDKYNEGWKPDWRINNRDKHVIYIYEDSIVCSSALVSSKILSFKSAKIRDKFFDDFEELIEIAKPLL